LLAEGEILTPQFAAAVDPVFRYGLVLLDRIQRGDVLDPLEEQQQLLARLRQGALLAGPGREWELAEYALVGWLDEMLVDTPWNGQDWWSNNVLERALYKTRNCHDRFYVLAGHAAETPRKDSLQVYHDCVVLGFRGLYRRNDLSPQLAQRYGLPPTVAEWLRRTQLSIRLGADRAPLAGMTRIVQGARPLTGSVRALWAWTAAGLMIAVNIVTYHLWLS
jgi:type VI secretion system protein ImpK